MLEQTTGRGEHDSVPRRIIEIGEKPVGDGYPTFIVAEIGINHNGDLRIAKKLIDAAAVCGCDAVKFQKRTIDAVYTPEELARPRESPFGSTVGDLRKGLEFGEQQFREIDIYCKEKGIQWFASPWDIQSADFLEQFNVPCYKVASACLTDDTLIKHIRSKGKPVIVSTGMSNQDQIRHAVSVLGEENLALLQCTSTYPTKLEDINLNVIRWLRDTFSCPIGYGGNEVGIVEPVIAVVLGASIIEQHITLDRAMWGSSHAASLEPTGLQRMVKYVREVPVALGSYDKRILKNELPVLKKLRRQS
jgi:N-acetylneuraminate synthase